MEFRAQGYDSAAAEALASKRLRENPPKLPSRKQWTVDDIYGEQRDAERQRKLDAGEFGVCPVCKLDVMVSQGIVLKHGSYVNDQVSGTQGYDGSFYGWKICPGEGFPVTHTG